MTSIENTPQLRYHADQPWSPATLRETSSPDSAHASDEGPSHSGTPPRGPCQEGSSSGPAAAEKRLDTMSGNFDPTTKTTQRHTRRGPSPYPGCTHPDAMLSGYIEQLAETPWPVVHTGAICGRCGAVDLVVVAGVPDPSKGGGDSPHAPAGRLAVSQREAFVAAMDGATERKMVGPVAWLDSDAGSYPENVLDAMRVTSRKLGDRGDLPTGFATERNLQDVAATPAQLTAFVWLMHCCEQALERTVHERNELRQKVASSELDD